jgi:hypothetical protein
MEVPEGFSGIFIPRELVLDGDVPYSAKLLFGMIMCLDREPGCSASDEYFGTILGSTDRAVRASLKILEDKGLIFRKTIDNRRYITTVITAQFRGGRKLPGGAEGNFHPASTIEIEKKDIDTPPNPQRGKGYDPMAENLPYGEKFKECWVLWIQHRRQLKKRMTQLSSSMTLATLSGLNSEEHACQAIREAIEKGWQGVYPRTNQKPAKTPLSHKDHERF